MQQFLSLNKSSITLSFQYTNYCQCSIIPDLSKVILLFYIYVEIKIKQEFFWEESV